MIPFQWETALALVAGLSVTLLLGIFNGRLLDHWASRENIPPPPGIQKTGWQKAINPEVVATGATGLGLLERILFFLAAVQGEYLIIGAWLAFKVASKWKAWESIIRPPEKAMGAGNDSLGQLRTRNIWGSVIFNRLMIGTLFNILIAILGAWVTWNILQR